MWLALILTGVLSFLIYQLFKPSKDFWGQYGVRQVSYSSLGGNLKVFLGKKTLADLDDIVYEQLGSDKFCGILQMQKPILLVKDMEVVKQVLIKDFDYFMDRRFLTASKRQDIINKMVGNLSGEEWKGVRTSLSPTFTTGKIRRMAHHFNNTAGSWVEHFKEGIEKSPQHTLPINVIKEATNFTVDAIGAAVFGMNSGTIRDPDSIFAKMVHKLATFNTLALIKFGLATNFPWIVKLFGMEIMDTEALNFFENILSQGLKAREEGNIKQNDFIQLLVEARKGELKSDATDELSAFEKDAQLKNNETEKKNYLQDDAIANAQALGFFFAGFSTTSNILGFVFYCLALNPEVQSRLRDEINTQLFSKGERMDIDYDELNRLPYMDMVLSEVLRKFPALGRLERICVKDYESGNLRVPKDAVIGIPVQSIHNDKQYYERPSEFYPEHFSPENKAKRSPYAYLPFGSGPRNCIGMRFALIEAKAAVAHIIHNFVIEPTAKTHIPYKVKHAGIGVQIPDDLELGLRLAK